MDEQKEKQGAGKIFSGDHRQRVMVFIDMMKTANDNIHGPLTKETAEDMIVFSECITATLHSFILMEELRKQAAHLMPGGDTGND